ncbi:MAG: hypothetical protein ABSF36_07865 [Candidatus Methanomethylicaceae archaeon]|jgi:hypothetical protein
MEQRSDSNQKPEELTQKNVQLDQQRVVLSELASQILVELNISSFNEFLKLVGPLKLVELMRPYKIRNTMYLALELRRKMNLTGNGPEAAAMIPYICYSSFTNPTDLTLEIKEKGAVLTAQDCIWKNASPEFCVAFSRPAMRAICDVLNPELDYVITHQLTNGDPYCRYIFKNKTTPFTDLDDMGKTLTTVPQLTNIPKEARLQVKGYILWHFWSCLTEGMTDYCGPEKTLEILGANAYRVGVGAGTSLVQSGMIKQRDVTGVGQLIDEFGRGSEQYGNVVRSSDAEYSKEIVRCPFTMGQLSALCKQFECFFNGICHAVNPKLQFNYSKMMTTGDQSCLWSVTKKT